MIRLGISINAVIMGYAGRTGYDANLAAQPPAALLGALSCRLSLQPRFFWRFVLKYYPLDVKALDMKDSSGHHAEKPGTK